MRGARGASGPGGTCRRGGPCCSAGVTGGAASGCASVGSVSASESVCSWAVSGAGGCCSSHCNKQVNSKNNVIKKIFRTDQTLKILSRNVFWTSEISL